MLLANGKGQRGRLKCAHLRQDATRRGPQRKVVQLDRGRGGRPARRLARFVLARVGLPPHRLVILDAHFGHFGVAQSASAATVHDNAPGGRWPPTAPDTPASGGRAALRKETPLKQYISASESEGGDFLFKWLPSCAVFIIVAIIGRVRSFASSEWSAEVGLRLLAAGPASLAWPGLWPGAGGGAAARSERVWGAGNAQRRPAQSSSNLRRFSSDDRLRAERTR